MKKLLLCIISIGGLIGGPAFAADMPIKAPPAVVPVATWTGFFVGGKIGGGFGDKWWNCTAATDCDGGSDQSIGTTSMDGFLGGLLVGYNWQTGLWVFGVEGQWDWTDMHGQFPSGIDRGETGKSNIHWIATLAGRIGFTIDRTLVYAGGGVAWMRETDTDFGFGESFTGSSTSVGATFLTGVEYMIDPHWSARIQYNFYDFGSKDVALPTFPTISTEARLHSITAGVNYRF